MHNQTFSSGKNFHLNACVGENSGLSDNRYGYSRGFSDAVRVLLSAAINGNYRDLVTGEESATMIDGLIYPICFCARHHIELFLKGQILVVSGIRGQTEHISSEHSLKILWDIFYDHCKKTDRRLTKLATPIIDFITDFDQLDPNGQVFRFAYDKEGNEHLKSQHTINIENFRVRFNALSDLVEEFEIQSELISLEYNCNTFSKELSRTEIEELANLLPARSEWNSDAFINAKKSFMEKYSLSNRAFSRAIAIIQKSREFSIKIGIEIPISEITSDVFCRLKRIASKAESSDILSREEWSALYAVCEIGHSFRYSDGYDQIYERALSEMSESCISPSDVLRNTTARNDRFRIGLNKLGQISLLESFNAIFPKQN
ncbi:hypothetical protein [uncultured Thiodictyon sp.]|uniref:hypothetical protein n=1 Tax=uncultured Thiodictyon sp. TaxID=1846217 RepID=UPI0025D84666|nr:hypothetical protein [uncultured Thiodictyon sp.]